MHGILDSMDVRDRWNVLGVTRRVEDYSEPFMFMIDIWPDLSRNFEHSPESDRFYGM